MTGQASSISTRDEFPLCVTQILSADASVAQDAARAARLRHCGLTFWIDGQLEDAAEALQEAARLSPDDSKILAELGSLLKAVGHREEARNCLLASLRLEPNELQTWLTLAGLHIQSSNKRDAEYAFVEALRINPDSIEALTGLGLLHFESSRYATSARLLHSALQLGAVSMPVYACLGQALHNLGEFSQAATAFEKAAKACPNERAIVQKFARARLIEAIITDSVSSAINIYRSINGDDAEDVALVCRDAFKALVCYGHGEAAVRLGKTLLQGNPEDPIISYHIDAITGKGHERTPEAYLTACFDHYAPDFDKHLLETLKYDVPSLCGSLLAESGYAFSSILDLGCGTGLAAPCLAPLGTELIGVDISARMLEKAGERNLYDSLSQSEAIEYLTSCSREFSLVVALDVLVYFGDLAELFASVAEHLAPGGVFAMSFEVGNHEKYRLQPSGRFTHNPNYIEDLCGPALAIAASVATTIRLEANAPVEGRVMLLRRRDGAADHSHPGARIACPARPAAAGRFASMKRPFPYGFASPSLHNRL